MMRQFNTAELPEFDYQVQRLTRMGYACALRKCELRPGEFIIRYKDERYELETCGDFSAVKQTQIPLTAVRKTA